MFTANFNRTASLNKNLHTPLGLTVVSISCNFIYRAAAIYNNYLCVWAFGLPIMLYISVAEIKWMAPNLSESIIADSALQSASFWKVPEQWLHFFSESSRKNSSTYKSDTVYPGWLSAHVIQ